MEFQTLFKVFYEICKIHEIGTFLGFYSTALCAVRYQPEPDFLRTQHITRY